MKKLLNLSLLFIALVLITTNVKAFSYTGNPECKEVIRNEKTAYECDLSFKTSTTWYLDSLTVQFTLTNATMDVSDSSISNDYIATFDKNNNKISLKTKKNAFAIGTHNIVKYYFYKIDTAQKCHVVYSINPYSEVRTCKYDETNKIYYDKSGNVTDELTYTKQCLSNICKELPDGTYFGINGNEVTKDVYESECLSRLYCGFKDGKYYGKDGEEVSEDEYQKQCERNYCTIITGTYFGKDGNEVTKEVYENECLERYICSFNNGKYYGKDGTEVSKIEYEKQCIKNICTILSDGTYYDKDGNVTDEKTYNKQCEKHTCEIIDDTYFDKDGNVTDEKTYNLVCKEHKCEEIDGKYFDTNGKMVNKDEFTKSCGIENPQTGNVLPIIALVIGTGVAGVLLYISKKNKKILN